MLACCAALISSCSATSDPVARLGLAPGAPGLETATASAATARDAGPGTAADEQPYFMVEEGDLELPDTVSVVPTPRESTGAVQLEMAAAAPEQPQSIAAQPAGTQPAPERFAAMQPAPQAAPTAQAAVGAIAAAQPGSAFAAQPRKRQGFFSSLFSSQPTEPPSQRQAAPATRSLAALAPLPAASSPSAQPVAARATAPGALPGVREGALFEVSRRNGTNDDSDIDLHEDDEEPVQLASAAGLARLAPNGLMVQTERVDVACLKPSLVRVLKQIESKYGRKVVVTSGYRSPPNNRRARGARNSLHMFCAAADIQVEGVTKFELATYLRTMPGRGGVGTYCHTNSVHIDVGPERDWNWRCRRKKRR